jgi:hypothetical protein
MGGLTRVRRGGRQVKEEHRSPAVLYIGGTRKPHDYNACPRGVVAVSRRPLRSNRPDITSSEPRQKRNRVIHCPYLSNTDSRKQIKP